MENVYWKNPNFTSESSENCFGSSSNCEDSVLEFNKQHMERFLSDCLYEKYKMQMNKEKVIEGGRHAKRLSSCCGWWLRRRDS
jgi:hypothetical protein